MKRAKHRVTRDDPPHAWPAQIVRTWPDFTSALEKLDTKWPNEDRKMFRGQSCREWALLPSLAREIGGWRFDEQQIVRLEYELAEQFRREAHRDLLPSVIPKDNGMGAWLPLLRHFGAPTRLLDWSMSPYVAAYFAVEGNWGSDGAIWWFSGETALNLMVRDFGHSYDEIVNAVFEPSNTMFDLSRDPAALVMFEIKKTIDRIGNQQSWFTLCSDPVRDHAEVLERLMEYGDGPHCGRIVIPANLKPDFLRHLQSMNITGKSMFPGLDGLGRTLTEFAKLKIHYVSSK